MIIIFIMKPINRQKRSIATVLSALENLNHPTALEIVGWLKQNHQQEKLGVTTVYRALKTLVEIQQVKPVNFYDGECRYELNNQQNNHQHLICTECKKISILHAIPPVVPPEVKGFEIHFWNYDLFGLCNGCKPQGC